MKDAAPGSSPSKGYQITLPIELSAQINDIAYWDNLNRSQVVIYAVADYIARRTKERNSPYLHSPNRDKDK